MGENQRLISGEDYFKKCSDIVQNGRILTNYTPNVVGVPEYTTYLQELVRGRSKVFLGLVLLLGIGYILSPPSATFWVSLFLFGITLLLILSWMGKTQQKRIHLNKLRITNMLDSNKRAFSLKNVAMDGVLEVEQGNMDLVKEHVSNLASDHAARMQALVENYREASELEVTDFKSSIK